MESKPSKINHDLTSSPADLDWSALNTEWENSKESQQAFCKRKNINPHTFTYWRTKFVSKKNKAKSISPFIPVKIKSENISAPSPLIIENKLGMRMVIPANVDIGQLAQILKLIGFNYAEN
ncbi:MAG: hypothetical protein P4M14_05825 [Gammaproteobacteria bacterium]|nr:hypothetical protein [Gammaproteobacteria bacterium]